MKKIGVMLVASMLLCSLSVSTAFANDTDKDTFEVTTYNYETRTEKRETLVRENVVAENNAMIRSLSVSNEQLTSGYNPGLPVEDDATIESNTGNSSRTIINADTQSYVNPNNYPYSAVLMIRLGQDTNSDGRVDSWTRGTAFLEGHAVAATAGHNIWSHTSSYGWVEECRIYVRQNSSSLGSTYYEPANWTVPTSFISNEDPNYDWAMLLLTDNLGGSNGWFGKGKGSTVDLDGTLVIISGYPTESTHKNGKQYRDYNDIISDFDENRLSYLIDTEAGQSGSPIYDSNYVAWGIHTLGGTSYNYGVQISDWLYDMLQTQYLKGVEKYG